MGRTPTDISCMTCCLCCSHPERLFYQWKRFVSLSRSLSPDHCKNLSRAPLQLTGAMRDAAQAKAKRSLTTDTQCHDATEKVLRINAFVGVIPAFRSAEHKSPRQQQLLDRKTKNCCHIRSRAAGSNGRLQTQTGAYVSPEYVVCLLIYRHVKA